MTPRFRVAHDPNPFPQAGERQLSIYELQFGLRINTFTNGTVIEDLIIGTHHQVIVKTVFVRARNQMGMLAYQCSDLQPPHPSIEPCAYNDDGSYNE